MNEGKSEETAITVELEKDGLDYDVESLWDRQYWKATKNSTS